MPMTEEQRVAYNARRRERLASETPEQRRARLDAKKERARARIERQNNVSRAKYAEQRNRYIVLKQRYPQIAALVPRHQARVLVETGRLVNDYTDARAIEVASAQTPPLITDNHHLARLHVHDALIRVALSAYDFTDIPGHQRDGTVYRNGVETVDTSAWQVFPRPPDITPNNPPRVVNVARIAINQNAITMLPTFIANELIDAAKAQNKQWECMYCCEDKCPSEFKFRICGHKACGVCHLECCERSPRCPECRA